MRTVSPGALNLQRVAACWGARRAAVLGARIGACGDDTSAGGGGGEGRGAGQGGEPSTATSTGIRVSTGSMRALDAGIGGETTMCANRRVLEGPEVDAERGGLTAGICAFSPSGHEPGDASFCTESCNEHSDCQNPAFSCRGGAGGT